MEPGEWKDIDIILCDQGQTAIKQSLNNDAACCWRILAIHYWSSVYFLKHNSEI